MPEDRLSFNLKAIDACISDNFVEGCKLYDIEQWLRENSREILDEAEEILNVKFQLIYTAGKQLTIDNGKLRWQVAQRIMSIAPRHMRQAVQDAGPSTAELYSFDDSHRYPVFRLLKRDRFYQTLCWCIADEFLKSNQLKLKSADCSLLIRYLTEEKPDGWVLSEAKRIIDYKHVERKDSSAAARSSGRRSALLLSESPVAR